MSLGAVDAIKNYLEQGRPFEVKFEGDSPIVSEAKGISKITLSGEELKNAKIKKSAGRKVVKIQKAIISSAAEAFVSNKVPFKVTFGTEESTIRFDLDHYVRFFRDKVDRNPEKCTVVGYESLDEKPIEFIKEQLSTYPSVKILKPKR